MTERTFAGSERGRPTIRSPSGQASVTGTVISASSANRAERIAALTAWNPGEVA
jgi:hypothetical protein